MKRALTVLATAAVLAAPPAAAEDPRWPRWHPLIPSVTSAGLAGLRATFLGTAGLSWPDGTQAVVTFWRREGQAHDTGEPFHVTYRCVDYFTAAMEPTGGKCELSEEPPPHGRR
jgi:hypothetical protein